ncbi:MAG: glycine cleavage system protein GcvH [Parachlamydia sp.]|nr:glycine cleavage system protein GcvH [Parachlamydia sp.]
MKFTDSHEWIEMENEAEARMGITLYAQKELGDIVYVELPTVGKKIKASEEIAVLESTKAAADVYAPISGEVIEVNSVLVEKPELVNQAPQKEGWIAKIKMTNPSELDLLMDEGAYQALLNGA